MSIERLEEEFALTSIIHSKSLDDRTTNVFIYGEPRIGKTVYAMKSIKQLCELRHFPPEAWKRFILFGPRMLISLARELRQTGTKAPGICLDDFGLWGFAWDWTDPELKSVIKLLQVAGTLTDSTFITAPSTSVVVKKVLTLEGILVGKVIKARANYNVKDQRSITLYRNSISPTGKRYINTVCEDRFSVRLPDGDYRWYKPLRESYIDEARKQMEKSLRDF